MLECLDANNCLEYFSMKQSDSFLKLKISRFLQNNSYLKCLKLPGIFFFQSNFSCITMQLYIKQRNIRGTSY